MIDTKHMITTLNQLVEKITNEFLIGLTPEAQKEKHGLAKSTTINQCISLLEDMKEGLPSYPNVSPYGDMSEEEIDADLENSRALLQKVLDGLRKE